MKRIVLLAYSSAAVDGPDRAPAHATLDLVGFKPQDFSKPIVGLASTGGMIAPCNLHIDQLGLGAETGADGNIGGVGS